MVGIFTASSLDFELKVITNWGSGVVVFIVLVDLACFLFAMFGDSSVKGSMRLSIVGRTTTTRCTVNNVFLKAQVATCTLTVWGTGWWFGFSQEEV